MGIWALQGATEYSLGELSARVVAVAGGDLPPVARYLVTPALGDGGFVAADAVRPRLITLELRSGRRAAGDAALRRALAAFCRPEAGAVRLLYAGAARTVEIEVYYLDGLEELAPRFLAPAPWWTGPGGVALPIPATITVLGTADTQPTFRLSGAGRVTAITATVGEVTTTLALDLSLLAGEYVDIDLPARTVTKQPGDVSYIWAVQPGAAFASFALQPGENAIGLTVSYGTVTGALTYSSRWWSYEDADG